MQLSLPGSSVVEQMPAKGMVVISSLTRSVGFPTVWPLCRQRRKLNTYFSENIKIPMLRKREQIKRIIADVRDICYSSIDLQSANF